MSRLVLVVCLAAGCKDTGKPSAPKPEATKVEPAPAPTADAAATAEPAAPKQKLEGWELPTGWRSEVIPFPLDFAPTLAHTGYEELRFPKGFFDPASPEYWSYAFVWRTDDAAELDAKALGDEITLYFRGLIAAVDENKRITARDQIVARAERAKEPNRFNLTAHVFDAFKTAQPIDLTGWAERKACAKGALWIFVLAPAKTSIRAQLDAVASSAKC
ncbi:MAG TPA: hypothetical protein VIV11_22325 [Kofleriaceae bacterium]